MYNKHMNKENELRYMYEEQVLANTKKELDKLRTHNLQKNPKKKLSIRTIIKNMVSSLVAFKVRWFGY